MVGASRPGDTSHECRSRSQCFDCDKGSSLVEQLGCAIETPEYERLHPDPGELDVVMAGLSGALLEYSGYASQNALLLPRPLNCPLHGRRLSQTSYVSQLVSDLVTCLEG